MEFFRNTLFDKGIYQINMLPARSHFSLADEENFNEDWYGKWYEDYDPEMLTWAKGEMSVDELDSVQVNLAPQLQGYGKLQYANTQYPFDGINSGEMGGEILLPNACMVYVKDYAVDRLEADRQYIINFKGSESGLFLYVNGQFAGYSENLYLDSEFDLTPFLHTGSNRLCVLCFQYCTSTWLLDQDFYRFSGLFRGVTLTKRSIYGIYDMQLSSKVACNSNSATAALRLNAKEGIVRRIRLQDAADNTLWQEEGTALSYETQLTGLQLWSAEDPALYQLSVESFADGKCVETAKISVGFRDVRIQDGILLLNGKRLIIKGVNRHEWNMERGRAVTAADMEFDVEFLKHHNVNAVRTSHYPNHNYFYELCDQKGLYMVDEACLESHGSFATLQGYRFELGIPGDDPAWLTICQEKLLRMYERDKNHPSVIIWSLGNEAGYGDVFFRMRDALKNRCPEAVIQYEQGYGEEAYMKASDVYSSMYVPAKNIAAFIENGHKDKPYILCEFEHAMGNSLGDMDAYCDLLEKYPTFQGGFIWDYIDQGLLVNGKLYYGGDHFDRPNDMDFCCNGIIFADRKKAALSSEAKAMEYYYQNLHFSFAMQTVTVENRNLFRSTDELTFTLERLENGMVVETKEFTLFVAPGKKGSYPLFTTSDQGKEQLYRIWAKDAAGRIVAREEWLAVKEKYQEPFCNIAPRVVEGRFNIGVWAANVHYYFTLTNVSFAQPGLTGIQIDGEEFITREVTPTIFRPNTSNDIGNGFRFEAFTALAYTQSSYCPRENIRWEMDGKEFKITYRFIMEHATGKGATVTYRVNGLGQLHASVALDAFEYLHSLPLVGMHLPIPKDKEKLTWFGAGPLETYPDRKKGQLSGFYESTCQEQYVDYIYPQECGNHEDVRYVQIHGQRASMRFEAGDRLMKFKYLPYSDFEIENATHKEQLPQSVCNHLTLCGFTRGVGGDDSWGSPVHEAFTLPVQNYCFEFYMKPIKNERESIL